MSERGGQIDAVQNGRLRIEKDRNRMLFSDGTSDRLLIGDRGGNEIVVDLSQDGFDVKTADINNLVFSSRFNLYKIIHYGQITSPMPRDASLTLSGNNIGYVFDVNINLFPDDDTQTLTGELLVNMAWDRMKTPISGSGLFYLNSTNRVDYKWSAGHVFNTQYLRVRYELRLISGSYSFNPASDAMAARAPFRDSIYYQVANMTQDDQSGSGGVGPGDGKYYYWDRIFYNADGTVETSLASSTVEFTNGDSTYFPAARW